MAAERLRLVEPPEHTQERDPLADGPRLII